MPNDNSEKLPPVRLWLPACPQCGDNDQVEVVTEYPRRVLYFCACCGFEWTVKT